MAIPKVDQPTLWKSDQNDNAKLKRELDSCEKENRSLNNLVAHIGEATYAMSTTRSREQGLLVFLRMAAIEARRGAHPMNLYSNFGGWTLVFAVLTSAVVCDAFGVWMGWLSIH